MNESMPIRLIATDIDGTLLNSDHIIPEENIRAIRDAQKKGIIVAIASGRYVENVYLLLQQYGLSCHIIGVNGAKITDPDRNALISHFIDPAAVQAVYQKLIELQMDYFIFGIDSVCTARQTVKHHSELSYGKDIEKLGFHFYHGPEEAEKCCQNPVHKFFVCSNDRSDEVRAALQDIPGIELTRSSPRNVEINPAGVNKARGIEELAACFDIPLSQVMALGDEENDLPMLKAAGWGVAMGNGCESVKEAARFITDTNNQGGWAKAVRKYALGEE